MIYDVTGWMTYDDDDNLTSPGKSCGYNFPAYAERSVIRAGAAE